jgi:hypothetical protein
VQERNRIKQEEEVAAAAEKQRLKDLADEAADRERKRHAARLCIIVFRALATDPETGRAKDPKDVFRALDQARVRIPWCLLACRPDVYLHVFFFYWVGNM